MPGGRPTHYDGDLGLALVEAAEAEIVEGGIGALSLRAVARRVGVSHAAPAHHFGDRAGLLTALATRGARLLGARLDDAASATTDPLGRLQAIGRVYVAFAREHPALFDVMLRPELVRAGDEALTAAEAATFATLTRVVGGAVEAGWGRGVDPATLALLAWSTVHGLATLDRDGQLANRDIEPEALAARVTGALTLLGRDSGPPDSGHPDSGHPDSEHPDREPRAPRPPADDTPDGGTGGPPE